MCCFLFLMFALMEVVHILIILIHSPCVWQVSLIPLQFYCSSGSYQKDSMHSKPEEKNWRSKVPSFNFKQAVMTAEAFKKKKITWAKGVAIIWRFIRGLRWKNQKWDLTYLPLFLSLLFALCEPDTVHSLFDVKQSQAAGGRREPGDDFQSERLLHRGYFDNALMIFLFG